MKKIFSLAILIFAFGLTSPTPSLAQGMMGVNNAATQSDDGHTAREEAEGKEIWGKLQDGKLKCEGLTAGNFGALGEYFMGQMMGNSHESMNNMMTTMMGEKGEEEMHVAMGKRMSGCQPNAAMPQNIMNSGMMQMMIGSGMMGNWSSSSALNNNFTNPTSMMNFGFAPFGWIFMILFWVLVIVGIVALVKWIAGQNKTESKNDKTALDILKERYAKGEINKKELEEKKKDLE
ncbi:MAG: SHOCT domain-containing protein [bacterium]|nr:SHOCT domain-containing protein [bacterium]